MPAPIKRLLIGLFILFCIMMPLIYSINSWVNNQITDSAKITIEEKPAVLSAPVSAVNVMFKNRENTQYQYLENLFAAPSLQAPPKKPKTAKPKKAVSRVYEIPQDSLIMDN